MKPVDYQRFNVTSRDLAIIRQHYANDEIIGYLWRKGQNEGLEERIKAVNAWLDKMVALTLKQPSDTLLAELTGIYKSPEILRREEIEAEKEKQFEEKMGELKAPPF